MSTTDINAQLRSDPRVVALLQQRGRMGGYGGARLTAADLRSLGYSVPSDSYVFADQLPRQGGSQGLANYGLFDNTGTDRTGLEIAAVLATAATAGLATPAVAGAAAGAAGAAGAPGAGTAMSIPWGTILKTAIPAVTDLFGAHEQASAANNAAQLTTDAANHAADVQAASARDALTFQRQSAENAFLNQEAARKATFDQWAAREARLGSIGARLGWGSRTVPGYVTGVDPHFDVTPTAPPSSAGTLLAGTPPPTLTLPRPGTTPIADPYRAQLLY
jgi:hypothetical protein